MQYVYSISEKKLGIKVICGMQINVKFSTSWYYPFWLWWPGMCKNAQNRKLVIFLQYIFKNIVATALCSIVMQIIQIFYGDPFMFIVTYFKWFPRLLKYSLYIKSYFCYEIIISQSISSEAQNRNCFYLFKSFYHHEFWYTRGYIF